jgi:hypothetical protein
VRPLPSNNPGRRARHRLYHIPIPKQTDLQISYNIAPSQKILTRPSAFTALNAGWPSRLCASGAVLSTQVPLILTGGRWVWDTAYPESGGNPYTGEPNGVIYPLEFTFKANRYGTLAWGIRQIPMRAAGRVLLTIRSGSIRT